MSELSRITANSIKQGALSGESFEDLSIPVTKLANSSSSFAGDYGSAGNIPSITINEQGIVTRVANVSVSVDEAGFNPFLLSGM